MMITGATGSFGKALLQHIIHNNQGRIDRLVVFSRDELKQSELQELYPPEQHDYLRFFLGDMRDAARVRRALDGIRQVVHAAALKQVPAAEYNPFEFVRTNVVGAQNLIEACFDSEVQDVVALSTDKAAAPINLYGATKLCSDKLITSANNVRGKRNIRLSVVRYGNVLGSRGSVVPFFLRRAADGYLPITDPEMTRFNITLQEGVDMVLWALQHHEGGEVFVPKIPSYRILDLAEAIQPGGKRNIIGIRPGEKLHEEMITVSDSTNAFDLGSYFIIVAPTLTYPEPKKQYNGTPFPVGQSYSSGSNPHFLTVEELRDAIRQHVDPNFQPVVIKG